jgi:hypothetical protein
VSVTPRLERTAFRTSRLLDFVSTKELTMQCGHGPHEWPLVVVKELIDNGLDACEEHGIAPEITVTVDGRSITVADNGPGIPPGLVDQLLDFSIRVSSREAYVAPDRGAMGNALKALAAMPFVLDGEQGRVDIAGRGVLSEIAFCVDRVQQRPAADVTRRSCEGSFVRVHWPTAGASSGGTDLLRFLQDGELRDASALEASAAAISRLAADFTFLNPHVTLTIDCFGDTTRIEATDPGWQKWTPSSPTSPHWYEPEHLERLIGAYITHDGHNGRERTVRELVAEFKGLTSTIKQKKVLTATGLHRAPLAGLLNSEGRDFDHEQVAQLLRAMQAEAKPVHPRHFGAIGRSHLERRFAEVGIHQGSFEYRRVESLQAGLPQVTEVAFAALADENLYRRLVTGVNWSAAWINPFRQLGEIGRSLDTMLTEKRFDAFQPIALLVHVAHPRVQYTDRGKSTVLSS